MSITDNFNQLRKGLLEFAVLEIISAKKVYAADILTKLNKTSFATGEGTLYPLLSRLKRDGLLQYDWVESESGPPRKYYSLTDVGKQRLTDLQEYWKELHDTLSELGGRT